MPHPLVNQLRFTRAEFKRALLGLTDAEARRRFLPLNSISWNVGHLAWQEQHYFLVYAQGRILYPEIESLFAYNAPASTPPLDEMLAAWTAITAAVDPWLETLDSEKLLERVFREGRLSDNIYGSLLQRVIYHYWYHTGENMAIRQNLGHADLPEFVGDLDEQAPFQPE